MTEEAIEESKTSSKPGPKRTPFEREADKVLIAQWYLQQKTQYEICELIAERRDYTLSQGQISGDLAAIRKDWLESSLQDFDARRAEELARIDKIEEQAWEAWHRSCLNAETKTVKRSKNEKGNLVIEYDSSTISGQAGDPRFLSTIQHCVERRARLLGLDAPKDVRLGAIDKDKKPISIIEVMLTEPE